MNQNRIPCMYDFVGLNPTTMYNNNALKGVGAKCMDSNPLGPQLEYNWREQSQ